MVALPTLARSCWFRGRELRPCLRQRGLGGVATEAERLATVEAVLLEVRSDVVEIKQETARARQRIHSLEGISSAFLSWQKEARAKEAAQYQRLGLRVQVLTAVVGIAAVLSPFLYHFLGGQ